EVATLSSGFTVNAPVNQAPVVSAGANQTIFPPPAQVTLTDYPVPSGGSSTDITTGPDGNVWFTEIAGNKIGKITPAGVITEFPIPTAASTPVGIASGPDGNLWFTEELANKIGRITTAGVVTEYSIPTSDGYPVGIASGPDGNLWFAEFHGKN